MSRYPAMFAALKERGEGAFVPFVMVGDPDPDTSEAVIEALIAGGADALELGVPFTDPVADGPTIQRAHVRALAAGVGFQDCLEVVQRVRRRHPRLPIGMLIYGNVPFAMGLERFYSQCAQAGIDSVLLPDVPIRESAAFSRAAEDAGVDAVYIAPPSAAAETLDAVAAASRGYVYAVSRVASPAPNGPPPPWGLLSRWNDCAPTPPRLSCWASASPRPEQVAEAIAAGADGAISGSATVKIVERYAPEIMAAASGNNGAGGNEERRHYALGALRSDLVTFTATMKEATRPH